MKSKKIRFSVANELASKYVGTIKKFSITKFRSTINKVTKNLDNDWKEYVNWKEYTEPLLVEFEVYKRGYEHYKKRDQRTYKYKKAKRNNQRMRELYLNKMREMFERLHAPLTENAAIINMYDIFGTYEAQYGVPIWNAYHSSEYRMWTKYVNHYFGGNEQAAIENYEYFKKIT